ncbi:MAG: hypothetical protein KGJ80_20915 [Chloroflexota bacterium]|nr:hypothetical protein [Chloroflexota bacterium]
MSNGKLRSYYWRIETFLAEWSDYLDTDHSAFLFPDENSIEFGKTLKATLVFRDGSRLNARATLDDRAEIREYDYAYIYYDRGGKRILEYDDAPHHPHVSTHPHHLHRGEKPKRGKERVYEIDLPRVEFTAIVEKVIKRLV